MPSSYTCHCNDHLPMSCSSNKWLLFFSNLGWFRRVSSFWEWQMAPTLLLPGLWSDREEFPDPRQLQELQKLSLQANLILRISIRLNRFPSLSKPWLKSGNSNSGGLTLLACCKDFITSPDSKFRRYNSVENHCFVKRKSKWKFFFYGLKKKKLDQEKRPCENTLVWSHLASR